MGQLDEKLFAALSLETLLRVSKLNVQDLANTAWAFATLDHLDKKLFVSLASEAQLHISEFNAQGLANTAWAFTVFNVSWGHLFGPVCARHCEAVSWASRGLTQLQQLVVWHREFECSSPLSLELRSCYLSALGDSEGSSSQLPGNVGTVLQELCAQSL